MCAQNHRCGVGPKQTCKSGPKVAVSIEKNTDEGCNPHRVLGLMETSNSGANHALLHAQNDR